MKIKQIEWFSETIKRPFFESQMIVGFTALGTIRINWYELERPVVYRIYCKWSNAESIHKSLDKAKIEAQKIFERMIKECLE